MSSRERTLGIATLAVVVAAGVYAFWLSPFLGNADAIAAKRRELGQQKERYEAKLRQRPQKEKEWKALEASLRQQGDDPSLNVISAMIDMTQKLDVNLSVSGQSQQKISDFREWAVETRVEAEHGKLVDLLSAIQESKDLLRVRRITVRSQYENEKTQRLDVDLRVSTVESLKKGARP
jgi:hypothetical protein